MDYRAGAVAVYMHLDNIIVVNDYHTVTDQFKISTKLFRVLFL